MEFLGRELVHSILSLRTPPYGSAASADDISAAERELGTRFPDTYRALLSIIGWGGIGHYEFYGVGKDVPDFLDLVQIAGSERRQMHPRLPDFLIPLFNDGAGNHYCLDARFISDGDSPVVFWNHELNETQEPEIEAESFAEWLRMLIESLSQHGGSEAL